MRTTFIQPAPFANAWKRLKLTDEDLQALEQEIIANPLAGALIPGASGLRKMRFAPPSWNMGKRGATRVCYIDFLEGSMTFLLAIYPKNVKEDLTPSEKSEYRAMIHQIRASLE